MNSDLKIIVIVIDEFNWKHLYLFVISLEKGTY